MPLIQFDNVSVIIRGKDVLKHISWNIKKNQNWLIAGPNGAGKTTLLKIILGYQYYRGNFYIQPGLRDAAAYVSFDKHATMLRREAEKDHARHFSGCFLEGGTSVKELLQNASRQTPGPKHTDPIKLLDISQLFHKALRQLSTGEIRKVLIAEALINAPRLLILDEPFDGLDQVAATSLHVMMERLMTTGIQILFITHRFKIIPAGITHALCLRGGSVFQNGPIEAVLTKRLAADLYGVIKVPETLPDSNATQAKTAFYDDNDTLIEMRNVTVTYNGTTILSRINWDVKKGQNWYISGPNGAGKSTLIRLITADNLQAYSNDVYLFGKKRGTGETIWDIKQKIGLISAEFHVRYTISGRPISAYQVVLSGFFDSVGLYRHASSTQRRIACEWLQTLGMAAYAKRPFKHLSYGEQRLILIIRAMVKAPSILILDEPFQGVDYINRKMLLHLLDVIGSTTQTCIIYVTHQKDTLACITHTLEFRPVNGGGFEVVGNAV